MAQQQLEYIDEAHAYIDRQVKKSQVKDYLPSQNPMDEGLAFMFPESQDAAVIDLEMELEKPMTKDFSLLSTTLDSIVNRINVLSNEVSNHTGIMLRKMEEMMAQRPVQKKDQAVQMKRPGKRKAPETDPYTSAVKRDTGLHNAPRE
jgi:hypothetical protein